ncbi:hypothetical protein PV08_05337 [Exophiala spinifera]|uniref:Uncharacterized protein n=1 Tax=Exophiala spinifera TaxID=91928 RepID=A0A0D1ZR55_9EURO|nr:uncharacterized protein PV08_05337 [Exophiala spinifera]KIW15292.1 hypothetical protein PV08_05337 [Exophiala spinifera]
MVKFRGIEICIISQFDIRKLPEFGYSPSTRPADPFQVNQQPQPSSASAFPTASCHVPIYPGSQVWFEYTVDGPHPPGAAYFFKLLINGKMVISWDCTAKHDFHGKMMYNLVNEGADAVTGESLVRREAFRFGDGLEDRDRRDLDDDMIQINVHRVEHRQRVRDLHQGFGAVDINTTSAEGLRLTNSGLLEPGFRPRRYKYQLLDPVDMPYAAFRFYCRPYEYLEGNGIIHRSASTVSGSTSSTAFSEETSNHADGASPLRQVGHVPISSLRKSAGDVTPNKSSAKNGVPQTPRSQGKIAMVDSDNGSVGRVTTVDDSLSIKTKDSIEELQSSVPRSPKSPRSAMTKPEDDADSADSETTKSPSKFPRDTCERLKKKLIVNINGADFDIERKKGPLSPFTSGGVLRKAPPQTAPAAVTEFGPTVDEEVRVSLNSKSKTSPKLDNGVEKTTRAERGGKRLMGFLGRRIGADGNA